MSSNFHINTRNKAEQALRQVKAQAGRELSNELLPAVVVEANGDGYDVATLDDAGNVGRIYERVFPHPSGSTLADNDECWLWLPSDGEIPRIIVAGGGGAGFGEHFYQGLNDLGFAGMVVE